MRIRLLLEYDGGAYHGWQFQPNGVTVQQKMEEAIFAITHETVRVRPAGRTDAGVHAMGQVADFVLQSNEIDPYRLLKGLNAVLPKDIAVLKCEQAPQDFNPQKWALGKTYRYVIFNRPMRCALDRNYLWHCPRLLNADDMLAGAMILIGEHDFSAFRAANCESTKPVQTMMSVELEKDHEGMLSLEITGTGFLKNMVRTIVGTLVQIGEGKIPVSRMQEILEGKDRTKAGPTAPARGLFLKHVQYEDGFGDRPASLG